MQTVEKFIESLGDTVPRDLSGKITFSDDGFRKYLESVVARRDAEYNNLFLKALLPKTEQQ